MSSGDVAKNRYWDSFYRNAGAPEYPSQFASFVMSAVDEFSHVVEFGCGNGRDSIFFAQNGKSVIGLDASSSAVALCRSRSAHVQAGRAEFEQLLIDERMRETSLMHRVQAAVVGKPLLVYARFLLHALNESEQLELLNTVRNLIHTGGTFAVEFRTERDRDLAKVTEPHYRRFLDSAQFASQAHDIGLKHVYHVEGYGYATYKTDDAHVYRALLKANV